MIFGVVFYGTTMSAHTPNVDIAASDAWKALCDAECSHD
jgi:hypothetical protein